MIHIKFNITNPWSDRWSNIYSTHGQIIKSKFWEIQFMKTTDLVRFELSYNINQDHAGFGFELGLAGYNMHFVIYDNRHWDYETKQWQN